MTSATGVPDILSTLSLGRAQKRLQQQLATAQTELVTGQAADTIAATNGDPMRVFALRNAVSAVESRLPLLSLAGSRAQGMQTGLESAQGALGDYAVTLLGFVTAGDQSSAKAVSRDARAILGQVLSALNVNVGGRYVFGGDEADNPPLGDLDTLLARVEAAFTTGFSDAYDPATGAATGTAVQIYDTGVLRDMTIEENLAHYFGLDFAGAAPPAVGTADGEINVQSARLFSARDAATGTTPASFYAGGLTDAPPVELGVNAALSYSIPGDAEAIRSLVMNLAVVVVAGERETGDAMMAHLETAAKGLIAANDDVTELRTALGLDQSRIEDAETRNQAEKATYEMALGALLNRDPYETASKVTELETQLQLVYALTARTSQLSLLNYL